MSESHGKRNIKEENILEKRKIKTEKNENEKFQLFFLNSYSLQNLITKNSIHPGYQNNFFYGNLFLKKLNIEGLFSVAIKCRIYEF